MAAFIDNCEAGEYPFIRHLATLLALYESGPITSPPTYSGPSSPQTDSILHSVENIARRMHIAEAAIASGSGSEDCGPETKRRRSNFNATHASSSAESPQSYPSMRGSANDVRARLAATQIYEDAADQPENAGTSYENKSGPVSIFPSSSDRVSCPICEKPVTDSETLAKVAVPLAEPVSLRLHFLRQSMVSLPNGELSVEEELQMIKAIVQDAVRVCNAILRGDFTQRMTVQVLGIVPFQIKERINILVCRLSAEFSMSGTGLTLRPWQTNQIGRIVKEITRVSREVGVEGSV